MISFVIIFIRIYIYVYTLLFIYLLIQNFYILYIHTELETIKEANTIVLETKDAMMRSLVKQNTLLVNETEVISDRNQQLELKVQQLQQLLRTAVHDTALRRNSPNFTANSTFSPQSSSGNSLKTNMSYRINNSTNNNNINNTNSMNSARNTLKTHDTPPIIKGGGKIIEF